MYLSDGTTLNFCPKCGQVMADAGRVPVGTLGLCDGCLEVLRYAGGPFAEVAVVAVLPPRELARYNELQGLQRQLRAQRSPIVLPPLRGPRTGAGP